MSNTISESTSPTPILLLVDGHSLAFRAYYAFAKSREGGLRTSTGIPTSVCYGFLRSLVDVIEAEKPQAIAIAFDRQEPTFRHEADSNYKANRAETPEDFIPDVENLQELLTAFKLSIVTARRYEADDVLGTLAIQGSKAGYRVKILTGDRDLFQLVDQAQQISVLYLSNAYGRGKQRTQAAEYDPDAVKDKMGIPPTQIVDYKALCGDTSDNIPGVKGIGPKTAVRLLEAYGSLKGIYDSLDQVQPTIRKKLQEQKVAAWASQQLARIVVDVPLVSELKAYQLAGFDEAVAAAALEKLELREFSRKLDTLQKIFSGVIGSGPENAKAKGQLDEDEGNTDFWTATETRTYQQQRRSTVTPQIIDMPEKLTALVAHLQNLTDPNTPTAWDTETTALDAYEAKLVGIGCGWGDGPDEVAYIPVGHNLGHKVKNHVGQNTDNNLPIVSTLEMLRPILESDRHPKVLQNTKFDRLIFKHHGIQLKGVVLDTLLASYVLNPDEDHSLDHLAQKHLKLIPTSYKELVPKGGTIADLSVADVAQYCGMDVHITFRLVAYLRQALEKHQALQTLLLEVEQPLEPVLAEMEDLGVRIDADYLNQFSAQLEKDLQVLEQKAYEAAAETFNLNSPKQLSELLFEKLNLNKKKSRKIQTGYSTDAAVLEKLQGDHPVIDPILEHRTLSKLKSTYVDALPSLIKPETSRVHTDFNQAATATGRLSSSNPNLQNIPIRTAFSRQIRKAFLPEPGWVMAAADYSQIELRILAHLSREPVLLDAYRRGEDVHTLTTQMLLDKEQITSDERRLGKTINFGVIYGMGAQRFARATGVDSRDARLFLDRFHDRYPQIFAYLRRMEKAAIAHGYVSTILGRRRYFNFSNEGLKKLRGTDPDRIEPSALKAIGPHNAGLLRAAANAPIQGSSADIIKVAMVKLHKILQPYQARLLLQVHDELVFELPPEELPELQPKIQAAMESAVELAVPLVAEIHSGPNWMEAK